MQTCLHIICSPHANPYRIHLTILPCLSIGAVAGRANIGLAEMPIVLDNVVLSDCQVSRFLYGFQVRQSHTLGRGDIPAMTAAELVLSEGMRPVQRR